MKRLLIQCQLSNYDTKGKFILEADSGYQMVMGRVREMLKHAPNLYIDIMCPHYDDCITSPEVLSADLYKSGRIRFLQHYIIPNALITRYDFDAYGIAKNVLDLPLHKNNSQIRYDAVYINDPMHLRNFKVMFNVYAGYQPKFFVHSHFVDCPSNPKFPKDASLWLGQCEAALKADYNFWQCQSALDEFEQEACQTYKSDVVDNILNKSVTWDDGYSIDEITSSINYNNVRFELKEFFEETAGKVVIFVPNRIGGKGRSSDYTNCGKFMFEILPQLANRRRKNDELDYVVFAGNPSQKFSNDELRDECWKNGYYKLTPDAFTRDEYKLIAKHSDIVCGLYNADTYGGTASRECIELGCLPLWLDNFEYSRLAKMADGYPFLAKPDMSDIVKTLNGLIDYCKSPISAVKEEREKLLNTLRKVVRETCSYEKTTPNMMKIMGLID